MRCPATPASRIRAGPHGAPVTLNAHPHFSPSDANARIALSHNGIIENCDQLRAELQAHGYVFASQTDSEAIAHLIDHLYDGDLFDAVRRAVARLRGSCDRGDVPRRAAPDRRRA